MYHETRIEATRSRFCVFFDPKGEKSRWMESSKRLGEQYTNLTGDVGALRALKPLKASSK